jgi:vacuole morphology and inheritance protein 14
MHANQCTTWQRSLARKYSRTLTKSLVLGTNTDALAKLSTDLELSVKNGAELLDKLVKDIVAERSVYHPAAAEVSRSKEPKEEKKSKEEKESKEGSKEGSKSKEEKESKHKEAKEEQDKEVKDHPLRVEEGEKVFPPVGVPGTTPIFGNKSCFNLPRFIPLLVERMKVVTPPGLT